MHKVSDLHKSNDLFLASRTAKLRELVYPFVKFCKETQLEPTVLEFQSFVESSKDSNYKLAAQIESIYGTSIWVHHAGTRAKNPKLTNTASNVFSSLFHINNNPNYSKIVLYDKYVMEKSKEQVPEVYKNLFKNDSNLPFSSQPHDAIHEEYNKKGVNVFRGKDVSDFALAFSIVDDIYELRSKMHNYSNVKDYMNTPQAKIPNSEPIIQKN